MVVLFTPKIIVFLMFVLLKWLKMSIETLNENLIQYRLQLYVKLTLI